MDDVLFSGPLVAALVTGLASSLHCLGMCGGAMAAIMFTATPRRAAGLSAVFPLSSLVNTMHSTSFALPGDLPSAEPTIRTQAQTKTQTQTHTQHLPLVISFNVGRIFSYSLAGAIAGQLGGGAGAWLLRDAMPLRLALFMVANLVMLLAGVYIAGWAQPLLPLERLGQHLWRRVSPFTTGLLPIKNVPQAALLGALWGWIPCGLVYAMLIVALASGSAINGAFTMLAFGLGTLPAMTLAGLLSAQMKAALRSRVLRVVAGIAVIMIALLGLNRIPALVGLANYSSLTALCHSIVTHAVKAVQ